jgi:RNase P/RNase MRP subunit p30
MINTSNLEQAKILIKKATEKPIIIRAQNDEFNRKMLEYGHFDIILGIEGGDRKRSLRNIDSGFNHVLANIAAKNKIAIGIDMQELSGLPIAEKARRLERIIQNIQICRKAEARIILLNYHNKRDALALLTSLGCSTQQAKEALAF